MKQAQRLGPKAVRGSDAARRFAALLLEAWSGVRTTLSASEAMGVAVTRFYQLEARALQMIVAAMELRPRGRQKTAESELARLKVERQRLLRDVERFQSLYRTSQRSLGVAVAKPLDKAQNPAPGGKRKRGPRKRARGQAVAAVLLATAVQREVNDGASEQGPAARGQPARRPGDEVAAEGRPGHADRGAAGGRGV